MYNHVIRLVIGYVIDGVADVVSNGNAEPGADSKSVGNTHWQECK